MADKYIVQRRTASGLEVVAELPCLEDGKVDLSWLPVVGMMGSAIIERGSNANGEYVKFADGTMWCMIETLRTIDIIYQNVLYRSETVSFTFPCTFMAVPIISVMCSENSGNTWCAVGNVTVSSMWFRAYAESSKNAACTVYIFAIGRWK